MKAELNGMKLEGTPEEILKFMESRENKSKDELYKKFVSLKKDPYNPFGVGIATWKPNPNGITEILI